MAGFLDHRLDVGLGQVEFAVSSSAGQLSFQLHLALTSHAITA